MAVGDILGTGLSYGANAALSGMNNTAQFMFMPPSPNPLAQTPGMNTQQYLHNANAQQMHPWMLQAQAATGMYGGAPSGVSNAQYQMAMGLRAQLERDKYAVNLMRNVTAPYDAAAAVGSAGWAIQSVLPAATAAIPGIGKAAAMVGGVAVLGKVALADQLISGLIKTTHRAAMGGGFLDSMGMDPNGFAAQRQAAQFEAMGIGEFANSSIISSALQIGVNESILKRPRDFIQRTAFDDVVARNSHTFTGFNPGAIGGRGFTSGQFGQVYNELKSVAGGAQGFKLDDVVNQFSSNLQAGEYSNVTDMSDFKRRLQSIKGELKFLKEIGKVTGESAADLREEMHRLKRELGVTGPDAFAAYKIGSAPMGAISGLGQTGVIQGGMVGAQIFQAAGFTPNQGYITGQRMATLSGMLQQQNLMSSDQWQGIGGAQGLTRSLIENSARSMSSGVGSSVVAGLAEVGPDGNLRLSQSRLDDMRRGKLNYQDLVRGGYDLIARSGKTPEMQLRVMSQVRNLAQQMPAEESLMFTVKSMEEHVYLTSPELRGKTDAESKAAVAFGVSQLMGNVGMPVNQTQAEAMIDLSRTRMVDQERQINYVRMQQRRAERAASLKDTSPAAQLVRNMLAGGVGDTLDPATGRRKSVYSDVLGEEGMGSWMSQNTMVGGTLVASVLSGNIPAATAAAAYLGFNYLSKKFGDPEATLREDLRQTHREQYIRQKAHEMQFGETAFTHSQVETWGMKKRMADFFSGGGSFSSAEGQALLRDTRHGLVAPRARTWDELRGSGRLFNMSNSEVESAGDASFLRDSLGVGGNIAKAAVYGGLSFLASGIPVVGTPLALYGGYKTGEVLHDTWNSSAALNVRRKIPQVAGNFLELNAYAASAFGLDAVGRGMSRLGAYIQRSPEEEAQWSNALRTKKIEEALLESVGKQDFEDRGLTATARAELLAGGRLNDVLFGVNTDLAAQSLAKKHGNNIFLSSAAGISGLTGVAGSDITQDMLNDIFSTGGASAFDLPQDFRTSTAASKRPDLFNTIKGFSKTQYRRGGAGAMIRLAERKNSLDNAKSKIQDILSKQVTASQKGKEILRVLTDNVFGTLDGSDFEKLREMGLDESTEAYNLAVGLQSGRMQPEDMSATRIVAAHGELAIPVLRQMGFSENEIQKLTKGFQAETALTPDLFMADVFSAKNASALFDTNKGAIRGVLSQVKETLRATDGKQYQELIGVHLAKEKYDSKTLDASYSYGRAMQEYRKRVLDIGTGPGDDKKKAELRRQAWKGFLDKTKQPRDTLGIEDKMIDPKALLQQAGSAELEESLSAMETFSKREIAQNVLANLSGHLEETREDLFNILQDDGQVSVVSRATDELFAMTKGGGQIGGKHITSEHLVAGIRDVLHTTYEAAGGGTAGMTAAEAVLRKMGVADAKGAISASAGKEEGFSIAARMALGQFVQSAAQQKETQVAEDSAGAPVKSEMTKDVVDSLTKAIEGLEGVKQHFVDITAANNPSGDTIAQPDR